MARESHGPIELVRIPDEGRYMWEPALDLVEFIKKGERVGSRSLPLHTKTNNYDGAMRVIARDIVREHPETP